MNHPDVIEADKGTIGTHSQVVVVTWVDSQTLGLDQLTTKLCQVNQNLRAFTALPQVILSVVNKEKMNVLTCSKTRHYASLNLHSSR